MNSTEYHLRDQIRRLTARIAILEADLEWTGANCKAYYDAINEALETKERQKVWDMRIAKFTDSGASEKFHETASRVRSKSKRAMHTLRRAYQKDFILKDVMP